MHPPKNKSHTVRVRYGDEDPYDIFLSYIIVGAFFKSVNTVAKNKIDNIALVCYYIMEYV